MNARMYADKIVSFFVGLVAIILGLRIFFRLFNANPDATFVEWVYRTSATIMEPFRGVFSPAVIERGIVLDIPAIFALIMYLIIGIVLMALIGLIPAPVSDTTVVRKKKVKR